MKRRRSLCFLVNISKIPRERQWLKHTMADYGRRSKTNHERQHRRSCCVPQAHSGYAVNFGFLAAEAEFRGNPAANYASQPFEMYAVISIAELLIFPRSGVASMSSTGHEGAGSSEQRAIVSAKMLSSLRKVGDFCPYFIEMRLRNLSHLGA